MGSIIGRFVLPQSPVEENHRVVGMEDHGSNVDGNHKNEIKKFIDSFNESIVDSHKLLGRKFIDVVQIDDRVIKNDTRQSFRIMQWNILADALCKGKDNFIKCPQDAKCWNFRKMKILEEILKYSPDIICLQEVDHFNDFFNIQLSKAGYKGAFLPKPWSPCLDVQNNSGPDGCAMFFNPEKFELVDFKGVTLKTLTFWTNHVALFQLLKFKRTGNQILVGTTHLKAKAGYENLRLSQGNDILRYLQPYLKSDIPIVLCGDFNATPNEPVYKVMREYNDNSFNSAYTSLSNPQTTNNGYNDSEPPYTTWCIRPSGENPKTVDYVFYSKCYFNINSILELPSDELIGPNRLPSLNYPSDHLSLVCDMTLRYVIKKCTTL
ncbi:nocturnin-like [Styela clava]